MPGPDHAQVTVATDVLRTEATEWEHQSTALGGIEAKVAGMELGRVEAGLFQLIVSPYNAVVEQVRDRCREGRAAATDIGATLRTVAGTYDAEDRANAHRIHGIY